MKLIINGDPIVFAEKQGHISQLLSHLQMQQRIVIVELNGNIISKSAYETTLLSDGDRIEIVHFVGGG
ncbi:sulfur carrier protein ThiS [Paenibacillus sp. SC116]|uniref:sulfur carrier protein ThiS n=1 Tax=Paenibacillus sp. SC116 TaxID=2968986 RepID=UPI00215A3632|nr:sulfur carrier protein ThiS [Paenibacillus sp. SC116]MCR8842797.1 sulfur carrier protein ThiS [Paenibacillus sp. SC116]